MVRTAHMEIRFDEDTVDTVKEALRYDSFLERELKHIEDGLYTFDDTYMYEILDILSEWSIVEADYELVSFRKYNI